MWRGEDTVLADLSGSFGLALRTYPNREVFAPEVVREGIGEE
jgi:hypothetical protein